MQKLLGLTTALFLTPTFASAQVTEWRMVKGPGYLQTADNTPAAMADSWSACALVVTTSPGDATSISISGGGIAGSLPFTQDGNEWFLETDHASQAAMNAMFPNSTAYTLTLSGGSLGTLVQSASYGAEQYPNTPYLTGTVLTDIEKVNQKQDNTLTWNSPGALTASNGVSILEVYDEFDNEVWFDLAVGGATSTLIPADTMTLDGYGYNGFLEFTNALTLSGAGGFGVSGVSSHNVALDFEIHSLDPAAVLFRNAGGNANSYSASVPSLGNLWTATVDLTTTGHTHAQVLGYASATNVPLAGGQVLLVGGPKAFSLPLKAGPSASWSLTMPNDPGLAGLTAYTQAVHIFGTTPFALSNAQDLVVGY